jgi:ABC-type glycerol-3-phosphate transport system substrate-binding protein
MKRFVPLLAALAVGLGTLAGCSNDKTTPAATNTDPLPGDVTKAKGPGRIPGPKAPPSM